MDRDVVALSIVRDKKRRNDTSLSVKAHQKKGIYYCHRYGDYLTFFSHLFVPKGFLMAGDGWQADCELLMLGPQLCARQWVRSLYLRTRPTPGTILNTSHAPKNAPLSQPGEGLSSKGLPRWRTGGSSCLWGGVIGPAEQILTHRDTNVETTRRLAGWASRRPIQTSSNAVIPYQCGTFKPINITGGE